MDILGMKIGNITIEKSLGEGGMGEVYLGYDARLERHVAVKAIRGDRRLTAEARERFDREAKVLAKLEHPNICRIYEFLEEDTHDFLILEYIKGEDLVKALERGLNDTQKMAIVQQIADGLAVAHADGIVHRDLKPENIMVMPDGRVKILDFGLAQVAAKEAEDRESVLDSDQKSRHDTSDPPKILSKGGYQTEQGTIMGTPLYMSPEQARGESATVASDMFSFGLLIQWLFTEESPYAEELTAGAVIISAMRGQSRPPEGLDPDLSALINRLKLVGPETRPTALDTSEKLRWIQDKPKRQFKRIAILAFIFVLLLGFLGASWGFLKARKSELAALKAKAEAETARDQSATVTEFLQSMLESADPREQGKDIKVSEVLDQASETVDTQFEDHPLNRAAVHYALGSTFYGLGRFPDAARHLETAYEIRRQNLGSRHVDTLDAMGFFAEVLWTLGKSERAERLLREELAIKTQILGEQDQQTIVSMGNLASFLGQDGQYEEAVAMLRDVSELCAKKMGNHHAYTLVYRDNLAVLLWNQGKFKEAKDMLESLCASKQKAFGEEHPHTLACHNNLALVLADLGDLGQAEKIHRETLEVKKRVLGESHPDTLDSMMNLAGVVLRQGDPEQAKALYRQELEIAARVLDRDSYCSLGSIMKLARIYENQDKLSEATKWYGVAADCGNSEAKEILKHFDGQKSN